MDKEELDRIKAQSNEVIQGIVDLQEQMQRYKSGAESFELAVGVLGEIAEREKNVVTEMKDYIDEIAKINIKKEKRLEKEIQSLSKEIVELKEILKKAEERRERKTLRLFRKK